MQVSRLGVLFIARREGLVLTAYQDGKHHSIGFGHNDPSLKPDDTITVKEAFARLKSDIAKREPLVSKALEVSVRQNEFDALFSLFYQGGSDGLHAVAALINNGDLLEAADEFLRWDTSAKGEHMPGLLKRRNLERAMFLFADYGDLNPIPFWRGDPRRTPQDQYFVKDGDL